MRTSSRNKLPACINPFSLHDLQLTAPSLRVKRVPYTQMPHACVKVPSGFAACWKGPSSPLESFRPFAKSLASQAWEVDSCGTAACCQRWSVRRVTNSLHESLDMQCSDIRAESFHAGSGNCTVTATLPTVRGASALPSLQPLDGICLVQMMV